MSAFIASFRQGSPGINPNSGALSNCESCPTRSYHVLPRSVQAISLDWFGTSAPSQTSLSLSKTPQGSLMFPHFPPKITNQSFNCPVQLTFPRTSQVLFLPGLTPKSVSCSHLVKCKVSSCRRPGIPAARIPSRSSVSSFMSVKLRFLGKPSSSAAVVLLDAIYQAKPCAFPLGRITQSC